ncbi:hypothetical protein V2K69_19060 [Pseudomonas alliivorans]|nr:hypothetical protein [Pseudomonas alliivorans]MEE4680383.1 hypothetical protein [Pseudomonas alliivorans]MEE4718420.1 hypothetical protein [Pseudomonas alliivorans]MEE4723482.1 hypothetical protein [Pseudomonas alliivorans]MEE4759540.1 hypothetical protein [Pseudomonas alliivorans]
MKTLFTLIFSASLAGFGTINTTFSSDSVAANKLGRWKSERGSVTASRFSD